MLTPCGVGLWSRSQPFDREPVRGGGRHPARVVPLGSVRCDTAPNPARRRSQPACRPVDPRALWRHPGRLKRSSLWGASLEAIWIAAAARTPTVATAHDAPAVQQAVVDPALVLGEVVGSDQLGRVEARTLQADRIRAAVCRPMSSHCGPSSGFGGPRSRSTFASSLKRSTPWLRAALSPNALPPILPHFGWTGRSCASSRSSPVARFTGELIRAACGAAEGPSTVDARSQTGIRTEDRA